MYVYSSVPARVPIELVEPRTVLDDDGSESAGDGYALLIGRPRDCGALAVTGTRDELRAFVESAAAALAEPTQAGPEPTAQAAPTGLVDDGEVARLVAELEWHLTPQPGEVLVRLRAGLPGDPALPGRPCTEGYSFRFEVTEIAVAMIARAHHADDDDSAEWVGDTVMWTEVLPEWTQDTFVVRDAEGRYTLGDSTTWEWMPVDR
ncbi:hypothetical protein [Actinokineospora terrae]|uniref:Uncharacterized protein n=1 Tax=Actinokineospora terrae TaxID=155974 RepID=A0A1H9M881_9PSEU|nr:hypothetical protein [Actinokineospora terrae]SER19832.1 hypothetical protein SAMN04487818_10213 [Actinokineospora terrae]